jgi:ribulose 1,5-bisphosphate carboxylase large subunit-like protein
MKPIIAEYKRDTLIDLVNKLGSEITTIYTMIEEDENISTKEYEAYDKQIEKMYTILQDLEEETQNLLDI